MKEKIIHAIKKAISKLNTDLNVELTPAKSHADFATNIAMKLASKLSDSPMNIANKIVENINSPIIERCEIANPGFINIFIKKNAVNSVVKEIISEGINFGSGTQDKFINVEYVSANPTGYLHLGHARGAAVGSTLVNILRFAGNKVASEFYINDAGNQMKLLGQSVFLRYQQSLGIDVKLSDDLYHGEDIKEVAEQIINKFGNQFKNDDYAKHEKLFIEESKEIFLSKIKEHLAMYNVQFDIFSSEKDFYSGKMIRSALEKLGTNIYKKDGATWLATEKYGDDKDRVLIKSSGEYTYLLPDISYHKAKIDRGYDELINIWGADHIGYIKRMEIALSLLGLPNKKLDVLIVQLVKIIKDMKEVKMSKRKGTVFSLTDLINEVSADAARWFMLDSAITSEFVFDLNKATKKNQDNPVFLVQYTHARANQLYERLSDNKFDGEYTDKETELINELAKFPEIIINIANVHKVNKLPQYLLLISRLFNSWYSNSKALGSSNESMYKDLALAVKIVINNGLKLMGINAPNKM